MTLLLILETAPHPQSRSEFRLTDGQLTIGRGDDCDWQIDDPQMFISRRHCVIVGAGGQYRVTDESRGGVFVDTATAPLGTGVTAPLRAGMRLRLGDFVIRAEVEGATMAAAPAAAKPGIFGDDFFTPRPEAPPPPRPTGLPDPFDAPRQSANTPAKAEPRAAAPAFFDDPFTMDHDSRAVAPAKMPEAKPAASDFDFGDFGLPADLSAPVEPPVPVAPAVAAKVEPIAAAPASDPFVSAPPPPVAPPTSPAAEADAVAALLRGLGIDPPPGFHGSAAEMEAIGRRYRAMSEGLIRLLRMRAQEKGSARVAQTVIGSANVNPLKFLVGPDEAVASLVAPKGAGYLDPDAAIAAALHDLMDHHSRSWTGLQASLRRMVDRFDPALFESEIEDVGMLKALVAGSKPARLWQLYTDRYREIAKSAEDRFLGEVGADFRDAYENETRKDS